jgi:uncharacterized membrane protein
MEIETSKILGGVGAVLMLIGMIGFAYSYLGVITLVGLILVMIGLYNLAKYYSESGIFNNALYGLIIGIVGGVVSVAVVVAAVLSSLTDFFYSIFPGWNGDWTQLPGTMPDWSNLSLDVLTSIAVGILAIVIILWVSAIIATFFAKRSLGSLGAKSGIGLFSTAGLLLFIGALLLIVVVGFILIWVALLLAAIAFFRMKFQQPQTTPSAAAPV